MKRLLDEATARRSGSLMNDFQRRTSREGSLRCLGRFEAYGRTSELMKSSHPKLMDQLPACVLRLIYKAS